MTRANNPLTADLMSVMRIGAEDLLATSDLAVAGATLAFCVVAI